MYDMSGTVGCRWALSAERSGGGGGETPHSWMLVDVGRPAAPPRVPPKPPHRRCFETEGVFRNSFETPSPRINFQQVRNRKWHYSYFNGTVYRTDVASIIFYQCQYFSF